MCYHITYISSKEFYAFEKEVVIAERVLLNSLNFDLNVTHPHNYFKQIVGKDLKCNAIVLGIEWWWCMLSSVVRHVRLLLMACISQLTCMLHGLLVGWITDHDAIKELHRMFTTLSSDRYGYF